MTLILALGTPLRGDDGIGAAVLEALPPTPHPRVDGGTPGLETILLMEGHEHVIVIDAADMGLAPGEWRRFTVADVRLQQRDMVKRGTLHYAGLAESLALGDALGLSPPRLTVFGIQPDNIDWHIGLSDAVQAAIPAVCEAILAELEPIYA